jgi:hypothetical protein
MPIRRILPAISLLLVSCAVAPAFATTAVVPDNFPTIQAGIDSWRDTVLVRAGHYDEDLVLLTGATLAVIPSEAGGDTVEAGGLSVMSEDVPYLPDRTYEYDDVRFTACRIDSGIAFPYSHLSEGTVRIDSCTIFNGVYVSNGFAIVFITNNTVLGGGVSIFAEGCLIEGNYVHGPAPYGIKTRNVASFTWIARNTVVATETGIAFGASELRSLRVYDNEVRDCTGSAFVGWQDDGTFERNKVARCGGYAFDCRGDFAQLRHNQAVDCAAGGVRFEGWSFIGDSNVVGRCGGPGFDINMPVASLRGNTSYLNQGAGFVVRSVSEGVLNVTNNIAYGNLGVGLSYLGTEAPILACNDWFANTGGATSGTLPGVTDLAMDPLFCGLDEDNVQLSAGSPLLDASGCGLIGALGQGCVDGSTPVLISLASADVTADGVKLAWFMGGSESGVATVYRSPVGGEWTRIGEVTADGTGYLRYTDPIVATATRVGYRLGMVDAGIEGFYGETWIDLPAGEAPLTFALDPVRPNPSRGGALMVRFSLPTTAPVRLELLDVAGRRVASREVGSLGAGQHAIDLGQGQHLAPGLYLVRLMQGANTRVTRVAVLQ